MYTLQRFQIFGAHLKEKHIDSRKTKPIRCHMTCTFHPSSSTDTYFRC